MNYFFIETKEDYQSLIVKRNKLVQELKKLSLNNEPSFVESVWRDELDLLNNLIDLYKNMFSE